LVRTLGLGSLVRTLPLEPVLWSEYSRYEDAVHLVDTDETEIASKVPDLVPKAMVVSWKIGRIRSWRWPSSSQLRTLH
jgi:hypothetical protein